MANCGRLPVTGNHKRVVVECQQFMLNGPDDLGMRFATEIGAVDTLSKKCVTGKQDVAIAGHLEARAAVSVAGRMDGADLDSLAGDTVAVTNEMINGDA